LLMVTSNFILVVAPVTKEAGVMLQVDVPAVIETVLVALIWTDEADAGIVAVKEPVLDVCSGFLRPLRRTEKMTSDFWDEK